jgi:hypothetical protein
MIPNHNVDDACLYQSSVAPSRQPARVIHTIPENAFDMLHLASYGLAQLAHIGPALDTVHFVLANWEKVGHDVRRSS